MITNLSTHAKDWLPSSSAPPDSDAQTDFGVGLGSWVCVHVLGMPALDYTTPLYAFLFLVALGVDYTIFLVTRAREETPTHGTREGLVRAVSTTGPVITSAGIVMAAVFCVHGCFR